MCRPTPDSPGLQDAPAPRRLRWYLWLLLLSVDMIGPFSTDAYLPNIPKMRDDLGCSLALATLTLQANWVVNALASSAVGALSDRLGRRPVLLAAMLCYVAGR